MTMTAVRKSLEFKAKPAWIDGQYFRAAAVYVLVRLCGIAILALLADYHDRQLIDLLRSWDGEWYLSIAKYGYAGVPDNHLDAAGHHTPTTSLAFFPAYPALVRLLAMTTGMELVAAALLINLVAGVAATCAIFRIGRSLDGRATVGLVLVALWAGAPMAITLSMTYTEALFSALAAWALVGVLERRWFLAGMSCAASGLVRPTAMVLVAVVGIAAVIAACRGKHRWPALACVGLCSAGLLGYWGYVAVRTGSLTGWFDIERLGWSTKFDGGVETVTFARTVLATGNSLMETMVVFIVLAAVLLTVLAAMRRIPWPLLAYSAGMVVLVAGSAGIAYLKARFLIPGFTLLIPIALGLANRKPRTTVAMTVGFVLLGCWFSAYSLTGWQYAI